MEDWQSQYTKTYVARIRQHAVEENVDGADSAGIKFSCEDALAFVEESETVGFAILDIDGKFVCVNAAFCRILNATWRQVIGTHFKDWTHEKDAEADLAAAQELAEGKAMRYGMFKRYIQRGSTKKNPREVAGFLEVEAVWKDGTCHRYRKRFTPYGPMEQSRPLLVALRELVPLATKNWRIIAIAFLTVVSIFGGSDLVMKLLSAIATARNGVGTQPLP